MARLKYSVTFPFRWLKEDRKYLKKNLERNFGRGRNQTPMHPTLVDQEPMVQVYGARLVQHAYQPKTYKMTTEDMTDLLSGIFPGARCLSFEKFFVQKQENAGLPVMQLEIYY